MPIHIHWRRPPFVLCRYSPNLITAQLSHLPSECCTRLLGFASRPLAGHFSSQNITPTPYPPVSLRSHNETHENRLVNTPRSHPTASAALVPQCGVRFTFPPFLEATHKLWACNHNNCALIGSRATGINRGGIQSGHREARRAGKTSW